MTTDTTSTTFLGYRVERTSNDAMPYMLYGSRGAAYGLLRYRNDPRLLYAARGSGRFAITSLKGHAWFTDADGTLQVAG